MYTEYVFDDKKYEVASKNLKSILFDIVNAEEIKLTDIRQKIDEADDSELKNKLINLCNQHETTLLSVLGISNKLNETIQNLDSFSKDLKELENEGIAVIISNYMEQQNKTMKEEKNKKTAVDNKKITGPEVEEKSNDEEKNNNTEKTEETHVVDDTENIDNAEKEKVQEEQVDDPVSDVPGVQNNNNIDEESSQVFSQNLIEKEKTEETDSVVNQENIENIFPTEQTSVEGESPVVKNISEDVEKNENSDAPVIESSEESIPAIIDSFPVETSVEENGNEFIPKVVQPDEASSSNEIPVAENDRVVSSGGDEIVNDVVETPSSEIDNSIEENLNNESESTDLEEKYEFEKQDSLEPKVILTSANQVAKLRASRDSNISLLTAKQFFKLDNADGNDQKYMTSSKGSDLVFPEVGKNDDIISQTESVFPQQELISTDNTVENESTKEEQMEKMMQQITVLYRDGKMDEAQALSDKVSEMNKELQETKETQKVLAA